jgi:outer membrane protein assembly factor BamB
MDLAQVWVKDTGGDLARPPFRAGDFVLAILKDGSLLGLDAASGEVKWQFTTPYQVWIDSLGVGEKNAFLGIEDTRLLGINTKNGQVQWDITIRGDVISPPLVENYSLYVTTKPQSGSDTGAMVIMLNSFNGDILWECETQEDSLSTPVRSGEYLYVANTEASGTLYALESTSGELRWTHSPENLPHGLYAHEDKVIYASGDSQLTALEAGGGQQAWTQSIPSSLVSMSGNDDTLLTATTKGEIFAHQLSDGSLIWSYPSGDQPTAIMQDEPVWIADQLYFISRSGDIVALDNSTGEVLWQNPTGINPATGLTSSKGWLYFSDQSGQVYAYAQQH